MTIDYSEGATPLDYDDMKGILLTHITTRGELDRWELENINQAYQWAERLKNKDIINEDFLCLLHKKMFGNVRNGFDKARGNQESIYCVTESR